jgi:phthiocerol/phenolphthiocerol synthesis type-I polyketide synthase E
VQIDRETAMGVRDKTPGLGFPIEMRIYRSSAGMHVDWWYDVRRVAQATVKTMAERFPIEFEELLSEALATAPTQDEFGGAMSELGLVDLSAE